MNRIIIIILISLLSNVGASQCQKFSTEKIFIAVDVTDEKHLESFIHFQQEELHVLSEYLYNSGAFNACNGIDTYITVINDLGSNRIHKIGFRIPNDVPQKQIAKRYGMPYIIKLKNSLAAYSMENYKTVSSTLLYQPLCTFLNQHVCENQNYTLILFSDGLENSKYVRMSRNQSISPKSALEKMEQSCECILPDNLNNLKIHLVSYRFKDSDQKITQAVNLWKVIFETKGANFTSASSLHIDHLNSKK